MLTCVEIKNYRGFASYQMKGLSRVNLLVGKNNSGKTALLEGIQFLTSGGDPAVLVETAHRRGEVIFGRQDPGRLESSVDIAHFFHGHTLGPDASFTITGENGYKPLTVSTFADKNGRANSGPRGPERDSAPGFFLKISKGSGGSKGDRDEPRFRISREGGVDFEIPPRFRRSGLTGRSRGPEVRFVGPDSLNSIELAMMWDEVTLTGQETEGTCVASSLA